MSMSICVLAGRVILCNFYMLNKLWSMPPVTSSASPRQFFPCSLFNLTRFEMLPSVQSRHSLLLIKKREREREKGSREKDDFLSCHSSFEDRNLLSFFYYTATWLYREKPEGLETINSPLYTLEGFIYWYDFYTNSLYLWFF